jgi:hypothetical protein
VARGSAAQSRVDLVLDKKSIEDMSGLALAFAAGFNEKKIDKALQAASNAAAKSMIKPVRAAAPRRTGRLARAVRSNKVQRGLPGAYVGIRPGKSRQDPSGAYYRWIVTSGVSRVPYVIKPKKADNRPSWADVAAGAISVPGVGTVSSVTRTKKIPGRPFVSEAVSRNIGTAKTVFADTLRGIIQRGIPAKGAIKIPKK